MTSNEIIKIIPPELEKKFIQDKKPHWNLSRQQPDWPDYVRERSTHPFGSWLVDLPKNNLKTHEYLQSDSEENWKKNRKHLGKEWHYYDTPVQYTRNSSGFRTYEWNDIDWKNSIVILGCSCTFGVGVDDKDTLSAQLEKLSGKQVINLGIPGASNQYITYCLTQIYKKFDLPTHIICNYTTVDRGMYFHETDIYHNGPWSQHTKDRIPTHNASLYRVRSKDLYFNNFYNPTNAMMQTHLYAETNNALCKDRSKLLEVSFFSDAAHAARVDMTVEIDGNARDLLHPGRHSFKQMAEWINEQL